MNDVDIQRILFNAFMTLNNVTRVNYLNEKNVALPNIIFIPPVNNRWFELSFLPTEPKTSSLFLDTENRWTGIFQIDIYTPIGVGENEANEKYNAVVKLFEKGKSFDFVDIIKTYRAKTEVNKNNYKVTIRIEWVADI